MSPPPLLHRDSFALVPLVWCELALVQLAWAGCAGVAASFAFAWLSIRCVRGAAPGVRRCSWQGLFEAAAFSTIGAALQPWLGLAALLALEASGAAPPVRGEVSTPCAWQLAAALVLAPLFEERLYREHLLAALAPRLGTAGAILASAACFALPHLEPLRVLGTFLAGLVLGLAWCATGRLRPCIALHAGFNAAALHAGFNAAALAPHAAAGLG